MSYTLPLAPNGIFRTIQGEGDMLGLPMVFVRLAGCSVGCALCDTDYRVAERCDEKQIRERVDSLFAERPAILRKWVWVTGGEPTDHEWLWGLTEHLKSVGYCVAVATAGHKRCPETWERTGPTWLSVSPHDPSKWVQFSGAELKVVPGLNGFSLADFNLSRPLYFGKKFVQPCAGIPETVAECQRFVEDNPGWLMTVQAHKQWGVA